MSRTHTDYNRALRYGSHSFTCKKTSCLPFVSQAFTRWRHDYLKWKASDWSLLLIYRPRRDERLSWPGWLTYSGWLTHISGYLSATGRVQDREVRRPKDRRYTTVPRNQLEIQRFLPCSATVGWITGRASGPYRPVPFVVHFQNELRKRKPMEVANPDSRGKLLLKVGGGIILMNMT